MGWVVEGTRTEGDHEGQKIRAVVECDEKLSFDQALLFATGQLRGMGFVVKDVKVERA